MTETLQERSLHSSNGEVYVADVCGPSWWAALHGVVDGINCPSCREHGRSLMSAMHDLVNLETGKSLHDPENFRQVAHVYHTASSGKGEMSQTNDTWGSRCRHPLTGQWTHADDCGIPEDSPITPEYTPGTVDPTRPLDVILAGHHFRFSPTTMKQILDVSRRTKKTERGFPLCELEGLVEPGPECRGGRCSIRIGPCRDPGARTVGFFHTHPNDGWEEETRQQTLSNQDLMGLAARHRLVCVSGSKTDKIVCALRKPDSEGILPAVPGGAYPYIHPESGKDYRDTLRAGFDTVRRGKLSKKKIFYPEYGEHFDYIEIDKVPYGWTSVTSRQGAETTERAEQAQETEGDLTDLEAWLGPHWAPDTEAEQEVEAALREWALA